jgi:hypothetical protein
MKTGRKGSSDAGLQIMAAGMNSFPVGDSGEEPGNQEQVLKRPDFKKGYSSDPSENRYQ